MKPIHARHALLPDGLADDVRIVFAEDGIAAVEAGVPAEAGDEMHAFILPAMANLHSHAFQRAMAGLAETRGEGSDSFWSWRTAMYRFALSITPDQAEAIAAQLYVEMLEAGYSRVGEFHYLHHDRDGSPYSDPGEMGTRIAAAAEDVGIGLTLLPVFYARAGFGGVAPDVMQRRFVSDRDRYARVVESCSRALRDLPGGVLGVAPHSLRAVTPEELAFATSLAGEGPIHIHVAEQEKEVLDCLAWSGRRPVQWLLENSEVSERWCLIHATHMDAAETLGVARSGAVVGLCPITEANLGDGLFPASSYLRDGGSFGVGSDSNIEVSLRGELRMLEYSQRLANRSRNVVPSPGQSTGFRLFSEALEGGGKALSVRTGLKQGCPSDFLSLDLEAAPWVPKEQVIDHFVFAQGIEVDCVWSRGVKLVEGGRHASRERVFARFQAAMGAVFA